MTDERKTPPTTLQIEDHALIGDSSTAALVARDGTIDFLCLPDFDSDGCFLSLLGDDENGRWKIAPRTEPRETRRQYRGDTLILETEFETDSGSVRLIDFMPVRSGAPRVVRIVQGLRGEVPMRSELVPRFSHGLTVPRERPRDGVVAAMAGPDGISSQLQIMYGIRGERRLTEVELDWLGGYEGARPVRIGNAAYRQFQLDVFGEFAAALHAGARQIGKLSPDATAAMKAAATSVAANWMKPDHGIWEMRGPNRSFTSSKVSAWIAIDRWVRSIEEFGLDEDATPWIRLRQTIFDEVCTKGFDPVRNTFTQYYGSKGLDGSLLVIPLSGFLPADDPRVVGTIAAIEKELMPQGLVLRYQTEETDDGLTGVEGVFLPCSFWLATAYHMMGRHDDARELFNKLVGLCNDVGLLAEEYDPTHGRQLGNFPQAFSHLALVDCAYALADRQPPVQSPVPVHAVA